MKHSQSTIKISVIPLKWGGQKGMQILNHDLPDYS